MGCASSKRIEAAIDVYRPPPTSFAVFDINSIEEPWLKGNNKVENDEFEQEEEEGKLAKVPQPILEKLKAIDEAPRSWDEVSKDLEDLKPSLKNPPLKKPLLALPAPPPPSTADEDGSASPKRKVPRKSFSFHTLEELEAKMSSQNSKVESMDVDEKRRNDFSLKPDSKKMSSRSKTMKHEPSQVVVPLIDRSQSEGYKPVKENIFLLRDRMEREKEGKPIIRFDPLSDYPEKCPPRGEDALVVYTTTLGGVRRTYEDCNKVRFILESHRVVFDERDVALHAEFRNELRELLGEGEGAGVPRLFVKGRYIGGVEEIVNLNETSRLGRILNRAGVEKGVGRLGCEGCGGARFVPCDECGGSCKVVSGDNKERCPKCNENGLIHCPACL